METDFLPTGSSDYLPEAARVEADSAYQALAQSDWEAARGHFQQALLRINGGRISAAARGLLVTNTLALSNLNFILGKGFKETAAFLNTALEAAENLGDRRSRALIQLHLARLYYFSDQRDQAMPLFEAGKTEVEDLGDEDIQIQAAEFLGLYFHIQGRFARAADLFEQAVESFEKDRGPTVSNPSAPIWLGYCAAYLGQFDRAIGILDYYRRLSIERGDQALAATTRAVLGIVLLELGENEKARSQLLQAIQEAETYGNALALYFARGGMAYYHFTQNRLEDCHQCLVRNIEEGSESGLIRQYASPAFLEMGFALYRAGYTIHSDLDFGVEFFRILEDPNIHLRGVLLRLTAAEKIERGLDTAEAKSDLENSLFCLETAGTPVELAKTRFALIRLYLKENDDANARRTAKTAWEELGTLADGFFPDDLRYLLSPRLPADARAVRKDDFLVRFLDIIQALLPDTEPEKLMNRLLKATNRYFGAERGALFWFADNSLKKPPALRAACNLTEKEIFASGFHSHLALVFEAFRTNTIQTVREGSRQSRRYHTRAILCLPFEVDGVTRGVLYHDNAYLPDCFNFLNRDQLNQLKHTLGSYIEHACGIRRGMEKLAEESLPLQQQGAEPEIIARSPEMINLLRQTDKIAATDSTVLLLGETGTGKELIASRIHQHGNRRDRLLVVVDPTALPENLVESELFGHEKGAFTGADRRRKGRLELAHQGTLFIDEVGEIPKSVQVKLLRALQDKTITRLGGTRPIRTDFRLIAATNRDLAGEVAAGRFREDLYYRLNVIPLVLPPLRERRSDIIFLARHYLQRYAGRYNRPHLALEAADEEQLLAYDWPGNVRELKNMIERGVLLSSGDRLALAPNQAESGRPGGMLSDMPTLDEVQRRYIRYVLGKTGGKIGGEDGAASLLGMKRTSLYNRMKKLNIQPKKQRRSA